MFIEKWKDIAFGSDFGGDFLQFLEKIPSEKLTLTEIYKLCDLQKYFDQPELLNQRTDNNVDHDQILKIRFRFLQNLIVQKQNKI
ncbi:hypothetical protein ACFOWU_03955 [Epilithonimonas zeae]|uniref:Uncharacterized protein n=1 Tax=Epilithonimonas zeae TaxID=1416779 RepID=A0A1N6ETF9_9FLAO|nr:hypothetical protein [Epilithonimonas zeae]SIN86213.1 hypothetical protein SAMN05444409_0837 [Epilithonimonas zeae]